MLLDSLHTTAGLRQVTRLGIASEAAIRKRVCRSVSKHGRLRWAKLFRMRKLTPKAAPKAEASAQASAQAEALPIKLEIAAGTGDWVIAQALADEGQAAWTAVELRHDRVYSIFSRMALQAVPNLCVLGGDAAAIVEHHLQPKTISHAFINFPEPPSGKDGVDEASNEFALLTPTLFRNLHRLLVPGGRLTIFSDNGR